MIGKTGRKASFGASTPTTAQEPKTGSVSSCGVCFVQICSRSVNIFIDFLLKYLLIKIRKSVLLILVSCCSFYNYVN